MFSHKYTENVKFGVATSGSGEIGVRCSPTNSFNALKLVLKNINCSGICNIFNALKQTSVCFSKNTNENEINRIHCFLNEDYDISLEKMTKISLLICRDSLIEATPNLTFSVYL